MRGGAGGIRRNRRVSPLMFYVNRSFGLYPSFILKGENEKTMYACVDEPERKIEEEIVTW